MSGPSAAVLRRHERRVVAMLADPECVGELLLVGLAMARSVDLDDPPWDKHTKLMRLTPIAFAVYGRFYQSSQMLVPDRTAQGNRHPRKRLLDVFRYDRRRYEPDDDDSAACTFCKRPMVRRDGLCGRSATSGAWLVDPTNGLRSYFGTCSQKVCRRWLYSMVERNRQELAVRPAPEPPANTGGVLERHLPEIDWWKVWRAVDDKWAPPPEGRPFERPTLTLLVGDEDPGAVEVVTTRPALTVLEGGWR